MPTQNNGKLASQTDNVSGEQVVYAYDALNRLASATATSGSWGQSYSYDGFGNLTAQNVTAGSAPAYSAIPDPTTNHVGSVDANGNTLGLVDPDQETQITSAEYDVENRFVGTGASFFLLQWISILLRAWQQARLARKFQHKRRRADIDHRRSNLLERQWSETGEL